METNSNLPSAPVPAAPPIVPPPPLAPPPLAPPPVIAASPGSSGGRQVLRVILSLGLVLFLADGLVSMADDAVSLALDWHFLHPLRTMSGTLGVLMALVLYLMMGVTPLVPKRAFMPVALYNLAAGLVAIPVLIYAYARAPLLALGLSLAQVALAAWLIHWLCGGRLAWPLVPAERLGARAFTWRNLGGFALFNLLVLIPGTLLYLAVAVSAAVGHYSEGFMAVRPSGFTVQVREYTRADGRTVLLAPMAHVGEAAFYRDLAKSFPTNALILMEGVTDTDNLLTNRISYRRMATSLGLAEQQKEFRPAPSTVVRADVDVNVFTTNTINFLNLVMMVHAKGLSPATLPQLIAYTPPPGFETSLWGDLLHKRNRHLLDEIERHLKESEHVVIPWGAAHIPEIARELQQRGFRQQSARDYQVIRFGGRPDRAAPPREAAVTATSAPAPAAVDAPTNTIAP